MIRNRVLLKSIAVFLIVETLFNTVAPTVSWALTAGPTAPEATSFEPVDTTDIVNLATGDLAYNVPLLEVPGPSGGYPLSLSYHAGIQPNEEASWVGLGWTLNTGSITRNVNGFVDDHSNDHNVSRYFWKGGETTTYETGVSVGLAGAASVSAGLSYSQDTYQGVGVGWYVGAGVGIGDGPMGVNARVGMSPYGDPYASAGVGLTIPVGGGENAGMGVGLQAGVSTNFKTVEGYGAAGVSVSAKGGTSILDASISVTTSGRSSAGLSIGGASYSSNSRSGRVSTKSSGFTIPIPIWYGIWGTFGKRHQRYWIDQLDDTYVSGALNFPTSAVTSEWLDNHVYDTYRLLDPQLEGGIVENPEPEKVMGGSFPDYDNYAVQAQGIAGLMRPQLLQGHLVNRNNFEIRNSSDGGTYRYDKTLQYVIGSNSGNIGFRFINDFSNRYEYNPPSPVLNESGNYIDFSFSGAPITGDQNNNGLANGKLIGSRHIEWFTNQEIYSKHNKVSSTGFIETRSTGFSRGTGATAFYPDNIGGFVIVNESGVKYHFALPVYAYDEYLYSTNRTTTDTFNDFKKPGRYAYTWFLTAITGPDFVDRGSDGTADGILNEHDWGYWVEFEYGKWTDQYTWRNPSEGMAEDVDNNFRNFSEGKKELYYLDAVRTRTHTALFVKDIRYDGKGAVYAYRDITNKHPLSIYKKKETIKEATRGGGFIPKQISNLCVRFMGENRIDAGNISYISRPTSVLKLDKIVLVKNEDVSATLDKSRGEVYKQTFTYNWNVSQDYDCQGNTGTDCQECDFSPIVFDHHLYQNVLDVHDIEGNTQLNDDALRVIQFNTDYSLSPQTSNSFDYTLANQVSPSQNDAAYVKYGKLTLNSIQFLGKGGADLLPPMKFGYEPLDARRGSATLLRNGAGVFSLSSLQNLEEGDIITFRSNNLPCYGLIDNGAVKILGKNIPLAGPIAWQVTKNPPYHKDYYDMWGLYKADFDEALNADNSDASRLVTPSSAKNLDVWSLRSITHSTGATVEIEYEPDSYKKPVLALTEQLRVKAVYQYQSSTDYAIELYDNVPGLDKILKPGNSIPYTLLFGDPYRLFTAPHFESRIEKATCTISSVFKNGSGNWVILTGDLSSLLQTRPVSEAKIYGPPILLSGFISSSKAIENFGGGVRTQSIILNNALSSQRTEYEYGLGTSPTSGVTSYEPGNMDQVIFGFPAEGDPSYEYFDDAEDIKETKDSFNKELYKEFASILASSREIPAPGVMYEYVTVREAVKQPEAQFEYIPNYTRYRFQVFDAGMAAVVYSEDQLQEIGDVIDNKFILTKAKTRKVVVKDYGSQIGTLKSVTLYNDQDLKVSETLNHYLHDSMPATPVDNDPLIDNQLEVRMEHYEPALYEAFKNQGVVEESFSEARYVRQTENNLFPLVHLLGVISKRETFPTVQTGQTVINYKTGIITTTTNLGFDFYSGQVTQTLSKDGYGNSFITEVTPAYKKYNSMGFAAAGGKNMLTQEAASSVYKVDTGNNNARTGLVSASAQTWSDQVPAVEPGEAQSQVNAQTGVWRKRAFYNFIGNDQVSLENGLYQAAQVTAFNAWNPSDAVPEGWQKNGEITLYDVNSHVLEASDINDDYAATKMSYDQSKVLATVANARYEEFAYSGAEETPSQDQQFGGRAFYGGGGITSNAHTGSRAVIAALGERGFTYSFTPRKRTYHVSVWTTQAAGKLKYRFDSGTAAELSVSTVGKAGDWYLLEGNITVTGAHSQLEIWCEAGTPSAYFDDFRVHPADAAMMSYVYNPWGELSHILDNNNLYAEYRYDAMGRLKETYKESFKPGYGVQGIVKLSEVSYNYGSNTPYLTTITASSSGATGQLNPLGAIPVGIGSNATFEIIETCNVTHLQELKIDNKTINLSQSEVLLADGTKVKIAGRILTFQNVQTPHSIQAQFESFTGGVVRCHQVQTTTGPCYDGSYDYAYYNTCGELGSWVQVSNISDIPFDLRDQAAADCRALNTPGCGEVIQD